MEKNGHIFLINPNSWYSKSIILNNNTMQYVSPIIFIKDNSRIQKNEEEYVVAAVALFYYLEFPYGAIHK